MCGVECGGDEAGVDGRGDQLLEGSYGGQIEGGEEVLVCEGGVGARQWQQRQQQELLVLLCGELGEVWVR